MNAADCIDCGQPHSGKNGAVRCRLCYLARRRKSQNLCDLCFDPITRNARRCRHCSYPRHGNARYKVVQVQEAHEVRPQLPETVRDTLLADRPAMRMEAERLARRCQSQFVLARWPCLP